MIETYLENSILLGIISIIWVLPWKAYSLWVSAKRGDKLWFFLMIIFNTFAVLEIIYIFYVAKKTPKEVLQMVKRFFRKRKSELTQK